MFVFKSVIVALTLAFAFFVTGEENSSAGMPDSANEEIEKDVSAAKRGLAKAQELLNQAKEKIGPIATNITNSVKESISKGLQAAQDVLEKVKEAVTSHVSPFVNNVKRGMLDGLRSLRDKLNKENQTKTEGEEGPTEKSAEGFPEQASDEITNKR